MNTTLLARVAVGGLALALLAPTVEARHRYLRPAAAPPCVVTTTVAAPVAAPVVAAPAPAANVTRSFSYEPAAPTVSAPAVVPTYRFAPAPMTNSMRANFEAYGKYRW